MFGDMRMAPYELVDRGDRLELHLEVPGIEKENVMSRQPSVLQKSQANIQKKMNKRAKDTSKAEGCLDHSLHFIHSVDTLRSIIRTPPDPAGCCRESGSDQSPSASRSSCRGGS
jgi:hypothetical protein